MKRNGLNGVICIPLAKEPVLTGKKLLRQRKLIFSCKNVIRGHSNAVEKIIFSSTCHSMF